MHYLLGHALDPLIFIWANKCFILYNKCFISISIYMYDEFASFPVELPFLSPSSQFIRQIRKLQAWAIRAVSFVSDHRELSEVILTRSHRSSSSGHHIDRPLLTIIPVGHVRFVFDIYLSTARHIQRRASKQSQRKHLDRPAARCTDACVVIVRWHEIP